MGEPTTEVLLLHAAGFAVVLLYATLTRRWRAVPQTLALYGGLYAALYVGSYYMGYLG